MDARYVNVFKSAAMAVGSGVLIGLGLYILERRSRPTWSTRKRAWGIAGVELPDLNDHQAVHKFFEDQMRLGENLLARGDIRGVDHVACAICVTENMRQMLHILQQALPPEMFTRLLMRLPDITPRRMNAHETNDLEAAFMMVD